MTDLQMIQALADGRPTDEADQWRERFPELDLHACAVQYLALYAGSEPHSTWHAAWLGHLKQTRKGRSAFLGSDTGTSQRSENLASAAAQRGHHVTWRDDRLRWDCSCGYYATAPVGTSTTTDAGDALRTSRHEHLAASIIGGPR